jgi:hypothetical protein
MFDLFQEVSFCFENLLSTRIILWSGNYYCVKQSHEELGIHFIFFVCNYWRKLKKYKKNTFLKNQQCYWTKRKHYTITANKQIYKGNFSTHHTQDIIISK